MRWRKAFAAAFPLFEGRGAFPHTFRLKTQVTCMDRIIAEKEKKLHGKLL